MPQQLEQIVQRMIDAGESEENIATVIRSYGSQAPQSEQAPQPAQAPEFGTSAAPWRGGEVGSNIGEQPSDLNRLLAPMARPGSASDFAGLVLPNFAGVAPALTNAAAPAVQAMGRGVERVGRVVGPTVRRVGVLDAILRGDWHGGAIAAAPTVVQGAGKALQRTGKAMESAPLEEAMLKLGGRGTVTPAPAAATVAPELTTTSTGFIRTGPAPSATPSPSWNSWRVDAPPTPSPSAAGAAAPAALSEAEKALLAKQGYPPEAIAKIERAIATSAAPAAEAAPAMAVSHTPPTSPLQQPRVQIGAERVGRASGMTKEEVRKATGPILGEAPGEASLVLPDEPFSKMLDKLHSLPKEGPARDAFVQAAKDPKTRAQLYNQLRQLRHFGMAIPAAAALPSVRSELERLMSSRSGS